MKTILILDDEKVLREAFAAYFEDRLWTPILAESGEEALALLKEQSPDAALVDIRLPGIAGDDFIRKAYLMKRKMAFVICTGSPEYRLPSDLERNKQVSKRVFRKPMTKLHELENEIREVLEHIKRDVEKNE